MLTKGDITSTVMHHEANLRSTVTDTQEGMICINLIEENIFEILGFILSLNSGIPVGRKKTRELPAEIM